VILNAATHQPLSGNESALVEIKGPKGDTVASGYAGQNGIASVWGFAWEVPRASPAANTPSELRIRTAEMRRPNGNSIFEPTARRA